MNRLLIKAAKGKRRKKYSKLELHIIADKGTTRSVENTKYKRFMAIRPLLQSPASSEQFEIQ